MERTKRMQSKSKKVFMEFFVRKPFGFVIFLILGTAVFILTANKIQVPVYKTVKACVEKEESGIKLNLRNTRFQKGTPVFLYHARDEHLEKITEYRLDGGYIVMDFMDGISVGEEINIDIQTQEVSLLRHIFMG